jgi:hypothetical protein
MSFFALLLIIAPTFCVAAIADSTLTSNCQLLISSPLNDSTYLSGTVPLKIDFSTPTRDVVQSAFRLATLLVTIDGLTLQTPFSTIAQGPELYLRGLASGVHFLHVTIMHGNSLTPFCKRSNSTVSFNVSLRPQLLLPLRNTANGTSRLENRTSLRWLWYTPRTGGTFNQLDS